MRSDHDRAASERGGGRQRRLRRLPDEREEIREEVRDREACRNKCTVRDLGAARSIPFSDEPDKRYNPAMAWQDRMSVNPAIRSGKPCIKGTRITVYDVLEYLAGGMTEDAILNDFPDLTLDDIRAVLAFAAARERRPAYSVA